MQPSRSQAQPSPHLGRGVGGEGRLELLALTLRVLRVPLAAMTPHPAPDHHAAPIVATTAAATWIEALGDAVELGAPRDVLLEALLGLLGDADALAARLLPEAGDTAGRRALFLLGGGAQVRLRQGADDHDLVVLDGDLYSREPAVREPSDKPTFDRSEFFVIHGLHNY